eukprot:219266-Rhodomonas_salina.1
MSQMRPEQDLKVTHESHRCARIGTESHAFTESHTRMSLRNESSLVPFFRIILQVFRSIVERHHTNCSVASVPVLWSLVRFPLSLVPPYATSVLDTA